MDVWLFKGLFLKQGSCGRSIKIFSFSFTFVHTRGKDSRDVAVAVANRGRFVVLIGNGTGAAFDLFNKGMQ
jgi:hypothetical protein